MLGVICQCCRQRPAAVHITEQAPLEEGGFSLTSLDICHHCLQERNVDPDLDPPSIEQLLDGQTAEQARPTQPKSARDLRCSDCQLLLSQFINSKRFGCSHDYDVFGDTIIPLLEEFHGASHHIGRVPAAGDSAIADSYQRRLDFERQLQEAIGREDYEEAARLRDRLQGLEP